MACGIDHGEGRHIKSRHDEHAGWQAGDTAQLGNPGFQKRQQAQGGGKTRDEGGLELAHGHRRLLPQHHGGRKADTGDEAGERHLRHFGGVKGGALILLMGKAADDDGARNGEGHGRPLQGRRHQAMGHTPHHHQGGIARRQRPHHGNGRQMKGPEQGRHAERIGHPEGERKSQGCAIRLPQRTAPQNDGEKQRRPHQHDHKGRSHGAEKPRHAAGEQVMDGPAGGGRKAQQYGKHEIYPAPCSCPDSSIRTFPMPTRWRIYGSGGRALVIGFTHRLGSEVRLRCRPQ